MTIGTIAITALDSPINTDEVSGPNNFNGYFDLTNMVAGQIIEVKRFINVISQGTPTAEFDGPFEITFADVDASGTLQEITPFSLELGQIGFVEITLTAGTPALDIPWRLTNLASDD